MKLNRFPILLASVWEMLRFLLLILFLAQCFSAFNNDPLAGEQPQRQVILWLLLFGSGQLVLPAGYLFLFLHEHKYRQLFDFLILGKVLSVFSAILLAFLEPLSTGFPSIRIAAAGFSAVIIPWLIILVDLAVLGILVSRRARVAPAAEQSTQEPPSVSAGQSDAQAASASLPDFTEIQVDDSPKGE